MRYYAQGRRFAFYLTRDEVMLVVRRGSTGAAAASRSRCASSAATRASRVRGAVRAPGDVNYLRGARSRPRGGRGSRAIGEVVYRELWPGIDLRLHEQAGVLKYEFRVRPGAPALRHPPRVCRRERPDRSTTRARCGSTRRSASLRDSAPVSYQEIGGARVPVRRAGTLLDGHAARPGLLVRRRRLPAAIAS